MNNKNNIRFYAKYKDKNVYAGSVVDGEFRKTVKSCHKLIKKNAFGLDESYMKDVLPQAKTICLKVADTGDIYVNKTKNSQFPLRN